MGDQSARKLQLDAESRQISLSIRVLFCLISH